MLPITDFISAIEDSRHAWQFARFGGAEAPKTTYREALDLLVDCVDDLGLNREPTGAEYAEWSGPDKPSLRSNQ